MHAVENRHLMFKLSIALWSDVSAFESATDSSRPGQHQYPRCLTRLQGFRKQDPLITLGSTLARRRDVSTGHLNSCSRLC